MLVIIIIILLTRFNCEINYISAGIRNSSNIGTIRNIGTISNTLSSVLARLSRVLHTETKVISRYNRQTPRCMCKGAQQ